MSAAHPEEAGTVVCRHERVKGFESLKINDDILKGGPLEHQYCWGLWFGCDTSHLLLILIFVGSMAFAPGQLILSRRSSSGGWV